MQQVIHHHVQLSQKGVRVDQRVAPILWKGYVYL